MMMMTSARVCLLGDDRRSGLGPNADSSVHSVGDAIVRARSLYIYTYIYIRTSM